LDGVDHRPQPLEARKARLAELLANARTGIHLVEHIPGDGVTIFKHACLMGLEGIVSKRRDHPYRSGPSKAWLKVKNPTAPGVLRFREDGT
jgi:bifunctional non-homologous end joining protein LigD